MTICPHNISSALDSWLDIHNLATLCKRLAGITAAKTVLIFVYDVAQGESASLKILALPRSAQHLSAGGGADFLELVGRGLQLTGVGTALGIGYAGHRLPALTLRFVDIGPTAPSTDEQVASSLLYGALVFIPAGSTTPAARRLRTWSRSYRGPVRLYPLWLSLTSAVPSVSLDRPRSRTAGAVGVCHTRDRQYRRSIDIRDAILDLSDHASPSLWTGAANYVEAAGLVGAQTGHLRRGMLAHQGEGGPRAGKGPPG